jgi:diaminohydroxyphosphoribosylaminopyrimidine deaminase/5-amino-6-(5-phosphoribosylamino)uracil reductase
MRHAADAVLTGVGTVLADDPALTDRSGLPRRRRLLRVVLDSRLRTPLDSQLVRSAGGDVLMVCDTEAEEAQVEMFEEAGIDVARVPGERGRLDLRAVLEVLGKRKILSVLLECGSELNAAFLAEGLVDKAALFYAPTELGDGAVPFARGAGSPLLLEQQMQGVARTMYGADACVSGTLRDPWEELR